ncbi:hypothetical protein A7982_13266 [Minicystis rosea]|nr:hypothetical protein A7982_13266 [Minicystis rosea]
MKASKKSTRKHAVTASLGGGIHPAIPELLDGDRYRLRLLSGARVTATLGPGVSAKLLDACMRGRRTVMLADGEHGPVILGALQTEPMPHVDASSGTFEVEAEHIRLSATGTLALKVGKASLALERAGLARIEGEQLVIDVAAVVRVLAAKVELP